VTIPVQFTVTYYYDGHSPDVDNIIKPIQDALNGLVFVDDAQVAETKSRKRPLNGTYQINGASGVLLQAFTAGIGFVHVRVEESQHNSVLDS
jgi:crossover junction endodeoxyribonuclease RusA